MRTVYIVGSGRSGSTILDLLLSSLPGAWTVGEANVLPFEFRVNQQKCGCGKSVLECGFWREVCKSVPRQTLSTDSGVSYFRETHSAEKILRPGRIWQFLTSKDLPVGELQDFCQDNKAFFKSVLKEAQKRAGAKYVVDASKSFYRAWWLSECEGLDMRFVHLTKDPRAFVYSKTKNMKGVRGFMQAIRDSIRYVVENFLVNKLVSRLPEDRAMHIRYEDFATNPDGVVKKIADKFDLEYASVADRFREVENHGIAGNASRMRGDKVRLDEKWRAELPGPRRIIATIIAGAFARRFGYYREPRKR